MTMYYKVYNTSKSYDKNTNAKKRELEIYCGKFLILCVKWYNIAGR